MTGMLRNMRYAESPVNGANSIKFSISNCWLHANFGTELE